jgi:hypothetical protein
MRYGSVTRENNDNIGQTLQVTLTTGEVIEPDVFQTGLKEGDLAVIEPDGSARLMGGPVLNLDVPLYRPDWRKFV